MRKIKVNILMLFAVLLILSAPAQAAESLWLESGKHRPGRGKPGELYLFRGSFPKAGKKVKNGQIWLETPDGGREDLTLVEGKDRLRTAIKTEYAGLYTATALYEDENKSAHELKRYYAKLQFNRMGREVKERKVEKHPINIPLEIVPITKLRMHRRLREGTKFILKVFYEGKPLNNVPLLVTTQEGWKKEFRTDKQGKVAIRFIKDRPGRAEKKMVPETYLFRVEYKKPADEGHGNKSDRKITYVATYAVDVFPSLWEWQSKSMGFLAVIATMMVVGGVAALKRSKKKGSLTVMAAMMDVGGMAALRRRKRS